MCAEILQLLAGGLSGQLVGAIVVLMVGMTLGPSPVDMVPRDLFVQLFPEVLILDRLLRAGLPAVLLPAMDPLGDPVLDVLRIGDYFRLTGLPHGLQTLDDCCQFHTVVGGMRLGSHQLAFVMVVAQEARPAARAGIAEAGAVCDEL